MRVAVLSLLHLTACLVVEGLSRPRRPFIVLVDPVDDFGTATRIEERVLGDEVELVRVYSEGISRLLKLEGMSSEQSADLEEQTVRSVDEALLKDLPSELCLGVLCESDTGLRLAEELGSAILPRLYNSRSSRRDKFMQQAELKAAGLRSIRTLLTENWEEARAFLTLTSGDMVGRPCVLKPSRGSASVGVTKASTLTEAETQFRSLLVSPFNLGFSNGTLQRHVLVQEHIQGPVELAIDTVSLNGKHKITASWRYDKRELNGAPFVYFSSEAVDEKFLLYDADPSSAASSVDLASVHSYVSAVLDALGVLNGPCHIEVIWANDGSPVLVEANVGRFHGQDFIGISNLVWGCNSVDLAIDALYMAGTDAAKKLSPALLAKASASWSAVGDRHGNIRCFGKIAHLSSHVEGTLLEPPLADEEALRAVMPSLFVWRPFYQGTIGERVEKTVDLRTAAGYALLVSQSLEEISEDYNNLVAFQKEWLVAN